MNFYHYNDIPEHLKIYFQPAPEIGLEETPDEYVGKLVKVFQEVKRVLKDNGTLWINLGDSYVGSGKGAMADGSVVGGGKQKTNKGTQMPESVTDRCTKAHEYIFLLSKSQKYYYDAEAIKEPFSSSEKEINRQKTTGIKITAYATTKNYSGGVGYGESGRNKRSVWAISSSPYAEAHFACYPPELITPCILAGSKPDDIILDPFNGAATTGIVSLKHGRKYIGIDLNPEYIILSEKRLKETDYTSENYKQLPPQKLRKGFFK